MREMDRRRFLGAVAAGCGAAAWATAETPAETRPPNIVFIVVDDMGWADLGCYGSKAIQTPRIDRMAAEGMRFTQAYSGCTVCAPARSTLMTGTHMGHTSVRGNTGGIPLPDADVTVAEMLKAAGYATGGFGKWGLGDLDTPGVPERQGFDLFYGYYHQIHAHTYYPEYLIRNGEKELLPGNRDGKQEQYSQDLIFAETLDFIRKHHDRPFFCYAPWTPPHGKYQIPEDEPAWQQYADKDWPKKARVAAAMDTMIDRQVGQLLDLLDALDIADNTIVFFCSDNGAAHRFEGSLDSSGPLRGQKRDLYEGGIRVPMVVRWPGKIAGGTTSALPCYFPDMLPTFADLSRAEAPKKSDGMSILPTLLDTAEQPHDRHLYWEWPSYNWRKRAYEPKGLMQAVRHGDWKLVRHEHGKPWELYNLAEDIGEEHNLAKKHPDKVAALAAWIDENRVEPPPQLEPEKPEGRRYR